MKLVVLALVSASLVGASAAEAHQSRPHYNAAARPSQVTILPHGSSRAMSWYSDTGWQPGTSALGAYGYGYGYGGAGHPPSVVLVQPQGAIHSQPTYVIQRSQPFGYVVDGYGRYPWVRQAAQYPYPAHAYPAYGHGYSQPHPQPVYYAAPPVHITQPPVYVQAPPVYVEGAQVHVTPAPVHVAPPKVEVAPAQIHYDRGYFAVPAEAAPPPPPPARSPTERPYTRDEKGERG